MKFIHIRNYDENGQVASRGGITIAYRIEGDEVIYAVARCRDTDNFNKQLGRAKASGRTYSATQSVRLRITNSDLSQNQQQSYLDQLVRSAALRDVGAEMVH